MARMHARLFPLLAAGLGLFPLVAFAQVVPSGQAMPSAPAPAEQPVITYGTPVTQPVYAGNTGGNAMPSADIMEPVSSVPLPHALPEVPPAPVKPDPHTLFQAEPKLSDTVATPGTEEAARAAFHTAAKAPLPGMKHEEKSETSAPVKAEAKAEAPRVLLKPETKMEPQREPVKTEAKLESQRELKLEAAKPVSAQPDAPVSPLVIIRFSQHNVYYERALYTAVNRALETKQSAVFHVVLKPGLRSERSDVNLSKVVASLQKMGLPDARLSSATSGSSGERFDEVDVYVR